MVIVKLSTEHKNTPIDTMGVNLFIIYIRYRVTIANKKKEHPFHAGAFPGYINQNHSRIESRANLYNSFWRLKLANQIV